MNTPRLLTLLLVSCLLSPVSSLPAFAQGGPLTPPGPPAPTMTTLDKIEPRIPINADNTPGTSFALYQITQPGSYYLTANVTTAPSSDAAIQIASGDVTVDLNGFSIISSGGAPVNSLDSAIYVVAAPTYSNITVRNGTIRGNWYAGFYASSATTPVRNCRLENLKIEGTSNFGIRVDVHAQIIGCQVDGGAASGFISTAGISASNYSLVQNCGVHRCDGTGISAANYSTVRDCVAYDNGSHGINAFNGVTLTGCAASLNGGDGIGIFAHCSVTSCVARLNTLNGINAGNHCVLAHCTANENGGDGISITTGGGTSISYCSANDNDNDGIAVDNGNLITGCVAAFNTGDGIQCGNDCHVEANLCRLNGRTTGDGAGIHAVFSDNLIIGNTVTDADRGIDVDSSGNFIVRNTASGNTLNYTIVANNKVGVIVNAPNSVAISGSSGGGGVGTTDPWANFSY